MHIKTSREHIPPYDIEHGLNRISRQTVSRAHAEHFQEEFDFNEKLKSLLDKINVLKNDVQEITSRDLMILRKKLDRIKEDLKRYGISEVADFKEKIKEIEQELKILG